MQNDSEQTTRATAPETNETVTASASDATATPDPVVPDAPEKKKTDVKKEIIEWVKSIAIALIIVFLVRTFLFTMIRVDGDSMLETLHNNDRIAATIIDLKINGVTRGDIVTCIYPGADHLCIKRVIGMPGDTIEIRAGVTYLNGEEYDEPYITYRQLFDYMQPYELKDDEYFVMGDNRANSNDSRYVGPLSGSEIKAIARLRLWPLNKIGMVNTTP